MISFLTSTLSQQPKMSVIINSNINSLFLTELSSELVLDVKIRSLVIYITQKTNFLYYLPQMKNYDSDFGHFLDKHVLNKNRVTMATV